MNISAKTAYACLAIIELASDYGSGKPMQIGVIAKRHGIPPRFLVQILLQMKGAGFVSSTRGASGGYQLIKDPTTITLADVMSVIEGRTKAVTPGVDESFADIARVVIRVERHQACRTHDAREYDDCQSGRACAWRDGADVLHLTRGIGFQPVGQERQARCYPQFCL